MNTNISILFVCLGNICRSPAAEGIMRKKVQAANLLQQVTIDSAGTGNWHVGNPPDARMQQACLARGYDLSGLKARTVTESDFYEFDYIFGMDESNLTHMESLYLDNATAKVGLLLRDTQVADATAFSYQVPDPYYEGVSGFTTVIDLLETATDTLLKRLKHGVPVSRAP